MWAILLGSALAQEVEIAPAALPAPVISAVSKRYPGVVLVEAERSGADFEVDIETVDGKLFELLVSADGTILRTEKEEAEKPEKEGKAEREDDERHEKDTDEKGDK